MASVRDIKSPPAPRPPDFSQRPGESQADLGQRRVQEAFAVGERNFQAGPPARDINNNVQPKR